MTAASASGEVIDRGTLAFTIESRVLRELGERLVKQPEVALLELVKNAYDADAATCSVTHEPLVRLSVSDDGHGMTFDEFKNAWMRIGTSSKETSATSRRFGRIITGEKGIGRFAVRFLGSALHIESTAFDEGRDETTTLVADFNWPEFDKNEDLGKVRVPYKLLRSSDGVKTGTLLVVSELRASATTISLYDVRTASIGIVTPYQSLLKKRRRPAATAGDKVQTAPDPGFHLDIVPAPPDASSADVAKGILDAFVLKAVVEIRGERLKLTVHRRGVEEPAIEIQDQYPNTIGNVDADIRFFPARKGTFSGLPIDGRIAKGWVQRHCGVAVFDREFRVHPYGFESDDWLRLSADAARRAREPRSTLAKKHFPMDEPTRMSTQLNTTVLEKLT